MSSKTHKKIWAGALAALLALFAAVVVAATPAKAAVSTTLSNVGNATEFAENFFGMSAADLADAGVTIDNAAGTVTVAKNATVDKILSSNVGIYLMTNVNLVLNNQNPITVTNEKAITICGNSTLTISGTGTIEGLPTGAALLNIGNGTQTGWLVMNGGTISNAGTGEALAVWNGDAKLNEDASLTSVGSSASWGALQVGGVLPSTNPNAKATCTVNGASVTGYRGATVATSGSLVVNEGSTITGTGSEGIAAIAVKRGKKEYVGSPSVTVNGGNITGKTSGIGAGAESNNQAIDTPVPASSSAQATITVSGGTVTGGNGGTGSGINDQIANGSASVTGGEISGSDGEPAITSNAKNTKVSGGLFSSAVNPDYLDGVDSMATDGKQFAYGADAEEAPSTWTEIPVGSGTTSERTTILATGFAATNTADALKKVAAKYGIAESNVSGVTAGNVMWVVYYGPSNSQYNVTANVAGKPALTGAISDIDDNNIGVVYFSITVTPAQNTSTNLAVPEATLTSANVAAGNWTVTLNNTTVPGDMITTNNIPLAALQTAYISDTSWNGTNTSTVVTGAGDLTTATTYALVDPEAEPTPVVAKSTDLIPNAADNAVMFVGWYQVSGTGNVSYTLYDGNKWAPVSPTLTSLVAGYAPVPSAENIEASLSIEPQNLVAPQGGTATLTVTVTPNEKPGSVILSVVPQPKRGVAPTVSNEAMINGVVKIINDTLDTTSNIVCSYTKNKNWGPGSFVKKSVKAEDATVSGNVVTATIAFEPGNLANPYQLAVGVNISQLGISGSTLSGPVDTAEPAATAVIGTCNVFPGIGTAKIKVIGFGEVVQTSDDNGNITLTATPTNGSAFKSYAVSYDSNVQTVNTSTLAIPASQVSQITQVVATFEGGTAPTPTDTVDITRLYNPYLNGAHLLSASETEVANLKAAGWTVEGTAFTEYATKDANDGQVVPVYRLYNPYNGDHFYTASNDEAETMKAGGWQREGTAWYAPVNSNVGVTRLYNPYMTENAGLGNHLWSANYSEVSPLLGVGWKDEGRAWFAVSA